MTRKHFELFAAMVNSMKGAQKAFFSARVIALCKKEKSRFNKDKFLEACGL
jgi:hypothetical protein